jgi:hypothetical protein
MELSFGAMIRHRTDLRPQPIHAERQTARSRHPDRKRHAVLMLNEYKVRVGATQ